LSSDYRSAEVQGSNLGRSLSTGRKLIVIENLVVPRGCVYAPRRFGSVASAVGLLLALSGLILPAKDPRILELDSHYQF
jgi:hypothetical protein